MPRSGVVPVLAVLASVLAILCAKASAVYDWGNIGGRVDPHFEQWYAALGPIFYLTLFTWIASIASAVFFTKGDGRPARVAWVVASLTAPPIVIWASSLYFHRGFPLLSG
jgi:hypothetical protein